QKLPRTPARLARGPQLNSARGRYVGQTVPTEATRHPAKDRASPDGDVNVFERPMRTEKQNTQRPESLPLPYAGATLPMPQAWATPAGVAAMLEHPGRPTRRARMLELVDETDSRFVGIKPV